MTDHFNKLKESIEAAEALGMETFVPVPMETAKALLAGRSDNRTLIYAIDTYRAGEGWTEHYPQYHSKSEAEFVAKQPLRSQIWRIATYQRIDP